MYFITYFFGAVLSFRRSPYLFYGYLLLLWLLASFRFGVGPDYFAYQDLYSLLEDSIKDEFKAASGQELLFRLFGSGLKSLSISYEVYSSIVALISLGFIAVAVRKYSSIPILSLFLYYAFFYLVWTYSGIRQGLALSIGTYYLLECTNYRSHLKFVFIVAVLVMIHASAIVLLMLYTLANFDLRFRTLLFCSAASLLFSMIPIVNFLEYLSFVPFLDRVTIYAHNFNVETIKILDFKSISRIAFMLLGFLALYCFKGSVFHSRIISAYIISFCLYFVFKFSEVLAANLTMYGFILAIIIIPNMCSRLRNTKLLYILLVYILSFAYLLKNLEGIESMAGVKHSELFLPYTHIFSPNKYQITGPQ